MKHIIIIILLLTFSKSALSQIVYWEPVFYRTVGITDLDIASNGNIFASSLGVFRSTDNGESWFYAGPDDGGVIKLTIDENDVLYAGQSGAIPGIYKSTDYGETWNVVYQNYVAARSMYTSPEGFIYVGDHSGNFIKSTDSGSTWSSLNVCDREISSITTLTNGQIFISTLGRSLFTSTDYGETWTQIVDVNLLNSISSVIADGNDVLYAEHSSSISKSTDMGQTWFLTGFISSYPSSPVFSLDDNNDLYYAYHQVFKSSDEGENWSSLDGPRYIICILLDEDRIFIGNSNYIYRHDPSIPIYVGNTYLPLNSGNTWQFIGKETISFQGELYYNYWLKEIEVTDDTLINGIKYYKYLNDWVRYSEEDKKIYLWYESERIHIDFTLIPETPFVQFPIIYHNYGLLNNQINRIATFKHGYSTPFATQLNYKGFGFDTSFAGATDYEEVRYTENLGPTYFQFISSLLREHTLVMSVLYDSLGNPDYHTNNYKPHISAIPLTAVNTNNFTMTVLAEHPYSRINWDFNFIDSVYMEGFYQKNDSINYIENVYATYAQNTVSYQIHTQLDTSLLINDFEFRYRIVAKDKGIIPGISHSPDSGYYKCIWDFGTNVNEEENLISSYSLYQNYPNPFNPTTTLRFQIPVEGNITLKVYDILGREIKVLVDEFKPMGIYQVEFNAENLSSGVYYYQLMAENFVETKKMVVVK